MVTVQTYGNEISIFFYRYILGNRAQNYIKIFKEYLQLKRSDCVDSYYLLLSYIFSVPNLWFCFLDQVLFLFQSPETTKTSVYNPLDREGVPQRLGNLESTRKFPFSRDETITTTGK